MGNTYGTWLPGSSKGFRTRHRRERIEGDYKTPPPQGKYDQRLQKSRELMSRLPVFLSIDQRHRALEEFVGSLVSRGIELEAMSIDRVHFHLLARFLDRNPRRWIGVEKRELSHYCQETRHAPRGGIWAVRSECKPIANPGHFHRTTKYILDHEAIGAAIFHRIARPPLWDFDPHDLLIDR